MQIIVEQAGLRNLQELLRIERECFTREAFTKEQIIGLLRNPEAISLLAKVNGEVAGFIIGLVENHGTIRVGHVYTIDVAVKHRRRRVGVKLLKEMEEAFLNRGVGTIYLEVRADNEAAKRLYRMQGYVEIEPLNDYYSTGVHGLRLKKQLKAQRNVSSQL